MPQRMDGCVLGDAGFLHCFFYDNLDSCIADVMPADSSAAWINREIVCREDVT